MRTLAEGLAFPEGPVALADGSVLLVEMRARTLTRIGPDGTRRIVSRHDGTPNGAAIGPDGRCYICNNGGFTWVDDPVHGTRLGFPSQPADYAGGSIERVDLTTGDVERLYTASDRAPLKGPNDLVFDDHGGFWFTDFGKAREREIDRGSVCYALTDGSACREVIFPLFNPNGIGLSPDGRTLYVAETFTARLWAFTVVAPGEIVRAPYPSPNGGRLLYSPQSYRLFDSLAVEASGNICVATLMEGGIDVVSPEGKLLEHVELSDAYTTNLCFGDEGRTAYVTLSSSGRLVALPWPRRSLD